MPKRTFIFAAAIIYALLGWTTNYALGFLVFENVESIVDARDAGAALVLPLLTSFLLVSIWYINKTGALAMAEICSINKNWKIKRLHRHFESFLNTVTLKCLKTVSIFAIVAAGLYLTTSGVAFYESSRDLRIILLMQAIPLWTLILLNLVSIYNIYLIFRKALRYRLRLSLFEIEKLNPMSQFLTTVFILFCGGIAIYALNIIYLPLFGIDTILLCVFFLLLLITLVLSLNTLKTTLTEQKADALRHLNKLLSNNIEAESTRLNKRRLVDSHLRLQYVSDLLLIRKEISAISSVPISQPTVMKLLLLFFLPLLSWIGAGIVSQVMKYAA